MNDAPANFAEGDEERLPSAQALTLLELMVTMVIVAVGICLLFPVFRNVQRKTSLANCASNLKQIGMAMLNYSAMEGNRLPRWNEGQPAAPLAKDEYTPGGVDEGNSWAQTLVNAGFIPDKSPVFLCPANKRSPGSTRLTEISYSMNARVAGQLMMNIETPSKLVLLTERYQDKTIRKLQSFGWAALVGSEHVGSNHQKSAAFLFVDGHAEMMRYEGDPTGHALVGAPFPPQNIWHLPEVEEETPQ